MGITMTGERRRNIMTNEGLRPEISEFEEIEAAVMETERGRWFLREFLARNRNADTLVVLQALDRLAQLQRERDAGKEDARRRDLSRLHALALQLHAIRHAISQERPDAALAIVDEMARLLNQAAIFSQHEPQAGQPEDPEATPTARSGTNFLM
jgi:hypothetical protein